MSLKILLKNNLGKGNHQSQIVIWNRKNAEMAHAMHMTFRTVWETEDTRLTGKQDSDVQCFDMKQNNMIFCYWRNINLYSLKV